MLRLISRQISNLDNYRRTLLVPGSVFYSTPPEDSNKLTEGAIRNKLTARFPKASQIQIEDISGGCGAMFQVHVEAPEFQGLNTVKQHKLINETLKEEISLMHGIRITTGITKS